MMLAIANFLKRNLLCKIAGIVFTITVGLRMISPATAETLTLGLQQNEAVQDVAVQLLTEIYKRAGLTFNYMPLPPARGTQMVLHGEIDGEVARIGAYIDKYPELIKVEPPYYYLTTVAFAKSERNIKISSREDLSKYRVGIIRGVLHSAIETEGVPSLIIANSVTSLFQMLELNRIDIAVDGGLNGQAEIRKLALTGIAPVGELARRDFFNVLTKQNSHLTSKISATIKMMSNSGELKKLIKRTEEQRIRASD